MNNSLSHFFRIIQDYSRTIAFLRSYRYPVALIFLFSLVSAVINFCLPFITKFAVDRVIMQRDLVLFEYCIYAYAVFLFGSLFQSCFKSLLINNLQFRYSLDIQRYVLDAFCRKGHLFYQERKLGDVTTRMTTDIPVMVDATMMIIPDMVLRIMKTIALVMICAWFNRWLAMAAILLVPIHILSTHFVARKKQLIANRLLETRQNYITILSSGFYEHSEADFPARKNKLMRNYIWNYSTSYYYKISLAIWSFLGARISAIFYLGFVSSVSCFLLFKAINGDSSIGYAIAFTAYIKMLFSNLNEYVMVYRNMVSTYPSFQRVFSSIDNDSDRKMNCSSGESRESQIELGSYA